MANLTDKQESVDCSKVHVRMREWQEDLDKNMTNEKFIDLYIGRFSPQPSMKQDERLRK